MCSLWNTTAILWEKVESSVKVSSDWVSRSLSTAAGNGGGHYHNNNSSTSLCHSKSCHGLMMCCGLCNKCGYCYNGMMEKLGKLSDWLDALWE